MNNLINFIALQVIWLIAVIGASKDMIWPSAIMLIIFLFWQLSPKRRHPDDFKFIGLSFLAGIILDSTWQLLGHINFNAPLPIFSFISPLWIVFLWIAFALTINHSLAWLKKYPILAVLLGFIGAPLSYFAGVKLGALSYPNGPILISLMIGTSWALIMYFFSQYHVIMKIFDPIQTRKTRNRKNHSL